MNAKKSYVVAVSGGVDSVVLLDMLANEVLDIDEPSKIQDLRSKISITVAHFDHGIRSDSAKDARFVGELAKKYGLKLLTKRVELGANTSEEKAREERYKFLRQCCKEENASLVTAHHQDDVTETVIINLIRGTGWRGLASMADVRHSSLEVESSKSNITRDNTVLRPLLNMPKSTILQYAKKRSLKWREDSTNSDESYLRNYVRRTLIPKMQQKDPRATDKLIELIQNTVELKKEIATELQKLSSNYSVSNIKYDISRYVLIMLPRPVAQELIYSILVKLDPSWHPSRGQISRVLHFIKTGQLHKTLQVSKELRVRLTLKQATFSLRSKL